MKEDLRGWLDKVESLGSLKKIEGADWNEEIGCISALNSNRRGPALLFDKIKGYPAGYRVATSVNVNSVTVAHTLNLPTHYSEKELATALVEKLKSAQKAAPDFPPKEVSSGPVLENVLQGKDIDLLKFPAPKWHELDGGRYIGTGDAVITRDPDTGDINVGTYRVMVQDKNTLGLHIEPERHARRHLEKYHERGKPCPVAVSFGHHPLVLRAGALQLPIGSEYGWLGAMRGEPLEVIIDEVTGLPIPADCEIVAVGWCPPGKTRQEGPFGEWPGYYVSWTHQEPVIEVERLYHRHNPIILGAPPHRPKWSDNIYVSRLITSAQVHNDLTNLGIPDIQAVAISEVAHFEMIVASIKQRYAGHSRQVGLALAQHRVAAHGGGGRYIIVVDEDIDPYNMDDVLWAMVTRADPATAIEIVHRMPTDRLDPLIGTRGNVLANSRAIIDACRPYEWKDEFPKPITMPPELVEKVKKKWGKVLGL